MATSLIDADRLKPINGFWQTRNTDLAACVGAFGVPIRSFQRIREVDSSEAVTWYQFAAGNEAGDVECATVDWAWRHRDEYEASRPPSDPLRSMRTAIESLQFITGVHYGRVRFRNAATLTGDFFQTDDWLVAACIRAAGYPPQSIENRVVRFGVIRGDPALTTFLAAYEDFSEPTTPVGWMHKVLEVRRELITTVKSSRLRTQVHYTHGDPLRGGKEAFIFEDCPEPEKRLLLEQLHA